MTEVEFEETETDDEFGSSTAFTPMRFQTLQRKVRDLNSDYAAKDLDPRPAFQRGYVWDKSRASKLIESILLNVPLPLIYTAEEEDQSEVVIDGQQRLLSVFGFIEGKFPKDGSPFKLTGLKFTPELNGRTFSQLDDQHKKSIQNYIFQIIRISNESHADVRFEIFERLNSGSVTLNAQELRNCVYRGRFNDVLKQLSETPDFRKCLGSGTSLSRMQDVELVLRFLAFQEKTYLNYNGSMKSFLNEFMNDFRNISDEKSESFSKIFRQAASLSYSIFGDKSFRKFGQGTYQDHFGSWERAVNRPLFDVTMWGFTRFDKIQIQQHIDEIREAMIRLILDDARFLDSITSAVGDRAKTSYRFEAWLRELSEIISNTKEKRLFDIETKRALFSRDPTCGICRNTIHSIDDAEVDHIEAYAKGGKTELANAQLAHRFCNRSKSSKSSDEILKGL